MHQQLWRHNAVEKLHLEVRGGEDSIETRNIPLHYITCASDSTQRPTLLWRICFSLTPLVKIPTRLIAVLLH
jgi:hypothetical protein